ncbi:hypothetical protein [Actinomadura sp. SCN-SB]|uniref:hypothetical protein n=1 Tax=Actinomadura sp. SCN-SB TaxID=3373092 RepID=UPI0037521825
MSTKQDRTRHHPHPPHTPEAPLHALARLLASMQTPALHLTGGTIRGRECLCVRVDGDQAVLRVVVAEGSNSYRPWFELITVDGDVVPLAPAADAQRAAERMRPELHARHGEAVRRPRDVELGHYWPGGPNAYLR